MCRSIELIAKEEAAGEVRAGVGRREDSSPQSSLRISAAALCVNRNIS